MSETNPTCTQCSKPYTVPASRKENEGLCETCRPYPVCGRCGGFGDRYVLSTKCRHRGSWQKCDRCGGTRHEKHRRGQEPTT